jgi:hypothetical protein
MTWLLVILLGIAIAAGIWFIIVRPRRATETESKPEVCEMVEDTKVRTDGLLRRLRDKISWHRRNGQLHQQFRQWVANITLPNRKQFYDSIPLAAQGFSDWLAGISPQEVETFSQRVSQAISGWNIQLGWLVNHELDRTPALKQAVEDSVLLYCLACWRATQAQDDIQTFMTFQAWQRDPYAERQRDLNHQMFVRLVESGELTAPSPSLFLAPEQQRREYVVQALRQLSDKDPAAFNAALQETTKTGPVVTAETEAPSEKPDPTPKKGSKGAGKAAHSAVPDAARA